MSSTKFEDVFVETWLDDVDNSACVLLLTETFEHKIVTCRLLILYQVVLICLPLVRGFDHQWICTFTNLTLKCFPKESTKIGRVFLLSLHIQPFLQAVKMNEPH